MRRRIVTFTFDPQQRTAGYHFAHDAAATGHDVKALDRIIAQCVSFQDSRIAEPPAK